MSRGAPRTGRLRPFVVRVLDCHDGVHVVYRNDDIGDEVIDGHSVVLLGVDQLQRRLGQRGASPIRQAMDKYRETRCALTVVYVGW
jgi:hypothetical protein